MANGNGRVAATIQIVGAVGAALILVWTLMVAPLRADIAADRRATSTRLESIAAKQSIIAADVAYIRGKLENK